MERRDAEIALAEAEAALAQAESQLADLHEGRRPEEIEVIEASLGLGRGRRPTEADRGAAPADRPGRARRGDRPPSATTRSPRPQVAHAKVAEIEAKLAVARLPARPQEIAAAEAAVDRRRRRPATGRDWNLDQRDADRAGRRAPSTT